MLFALLAANIPYLDDFLSPIGLQIGIPTEYNVETENDIKAKLWEKIKEINKTMPKYKYVKELIITEEELIKTTTLKIKRHEEMKKIMK